jgi:hypothetical protein
MMIARIGVGLLGLSLLMGRPAFAGPGTIDPALRADIERLLDITGTEETSLRMASATTDYMLERLRASRPAMPERAYDIAKQVLMDEFVKAYAAPDGLGARLVEIYAGHFTREEVKGLLKFYGSDLGMKTMGLMPMLMQESAVAGQEWMRTHMPQIGDALERRLKAEGFLE